MTENADGAKEGYIAVPNSHHIDPSWILMINDQQPIVSVGECVPTDNVSVPEHYFSRKISEVISNLDGRDAKGASSVRAVLDILGDIFIRQKTINGTVTKLTASNDCLNGDDERSGLEAWQIKLMETFSSLDAELQKSEPPNLEIFRELFTALFRLNIELCFIKRAFTVMSIFSPHKGQLFHHADKERSKTDFRFERLHALTNNAIFARWQEFEKRIGDRESASFGLKQLHRVAYRALLKENDFLFQDKSNDPRHGRSIFDTSKLSS